MIGMTEISEMSKITESNLIGCLYNNPNLFLDHDELSSNDFNNEQWRFMFALGKKMALRGYNTLTSMDVETFIEQLGNEKIASGFEYYGGTRLVEDLHMIFDGNDNINVYIDDLKKWKAIAEIQKNFSIESKEDLVRLSKGSFNTLYDLFTAKLNNIFVNINEDVHTQEIGYGLDELIEDANKGMKRGLPIDSPILSDTINGINLGQIMLIGGQSGSGKSTWLIQQVLTSVFNNEEAAVFFLNEQDAKRFQQELLTWIINNVVLAGTNRFFNKVRWRDGGFSQEEFEWLYQAKEILENKTKNNKIIIVEFKTYSHKVVVRSIKKYAALGVKIFAIDTFKLSSDADPKNPFWLEMMQQMREFDDLVKPSNLNVSLICTLQLGKGAIVSRYLSANDLGMSKNIIDVASTCLLIRKMHADEYKGEKNEIKVWNTVGDSRFEIELDPARRHSIIFIEKNRNGIAQEFQVVAQHDFATFKYKEMGKSYISIGV